MNDEQLTRLFRSLENTAEPSPDFADALFARLEREAGHAVARRQTSVRWVLLAATLLLAAALGAAIAVGSGLLKLPSAVESPTPLLSASPLPTASVSPSAQQTPAPTPSIPELAYLSGLAATPDGFLAVGTVSSSASAAPAPSVVLRGASDGTTWQASPPSRFGEVASLATSHSASIMLTNTVQDLSGRWVIWRSTDGQAWSANEAWTSESNPEPVAVAGGPAGFVIWGVNDSSTLPAHTALWTSANGTVWRRSSITNSGVSGAIVLDKGFLVEGGSGLIASLDGVSWEQVSSPVAAAGGQAITSLFGIGPDLVAVTCEGTQLNPCSVWTGRLAGSSGSLSIRWQPAAGGQFLSGYAFTTATAAPDRALLFGYDVKTYEREVWTSTDGATWTRSALAADAFGGGMPSSFVAGQSAVLGIGWTESTLAGSGRELWRSADGLSWTPANAPLVPPAPQVPSGPCPAAPTTIQQLLDIGFVKAASCYGSGSLTIHAYSSNCGGCGGTGFPTTMSPGWIANSYAAPWYVSPAVTTPGGRGTRASVWLLPSAHLTPPAEGTPVVITGHFNDAVSPDCRITPVRNGVELPPTSDASATCERSFVVTAITVGG